MAYRHKANEEYCQFLSTLDNVFLRLKSIASKVELKNTLKKHKLKYNRIERDSDFWDEIFTNAQIPSIYESVLLLDNKYVFCHDDRIIKVLVNNRQEKKYVEVLSANRKTNWWAIEDYEEIPHEVTTTLESVLVEAERLYEQYNRKQVKNERTVRRTNRPTKS